MPTDLTVVMQDQPGELARIAEVAVSAGVHLRGLAAFTGDGRGFVHVLVDDDDVAPVRQAALAAQHQDRRRRARCSSSSSTTGPAGSST